MENTLIFGFALMALCGLILGLVIGFFAKVFKVPVDDRVGLVLELLPNVNCGGCGRAGCADFARAVIAGEASPGGCPVSSREAVSAISMALGIEPGEVEKRVAAVFCCGDDFSTRQRVHYNGVYDCVSASLVAGGPKVCAHGCLGMASCAKVCPFGAIEMVNSLAVVHPELCVGCGKCVERCPRKLIGLVPENAKLHVYCSSPDKGANKKNYCQSGCIGCRKCAKAAEGKFTFSGFCAKVDYSQKDSLPGEELIELAGCPPGCLRTGAGHLEIEYKERLANET